MKQLIIALFMLMPVFALAQGPRGGDEKIEAAKRNPRRSEGPLRGHALACPQKRRSRTIIREELKVGALQ